MKFSSVVSHCLFQRILHAVGHSTQVSHGVPCALRDTSSPITQGLFCSGCVLCVFVFLLPVSPSSSRISSDLPSCGCSVTLISIQAPGSVPTWSEGWARAAVGQRMCLSSHEPEHSKPSGLLIPTFFCNSWL